MSKKTLHGGWDEEEEDAWILPRRQRLKRADYVRSEEPEKVWLGRGYTHAAFVFCRNGYDVTSVHRSEAEAQAALAEGAREWCGDYCCNRHYVIALSEVAQLPAEVPGAKAVDEEELPMDISKLVLTGPTRSAIRTALRENVRLESQVA